jgi:hypothetical protein
MRKLRLDPNALRVQSFAPRDEAAGPRGTVDAHSFVSELVITGCCEGPSRYCQETDYHWRTCGSSCVEMCLPTGNDPSCAC